MPHSTQEELGKFAQRLRVAVEKSVVSVEKENLVFPITVSIGGVVGLKETPAELIQQADGLLYEAKNSGRNCVKVQL
ncbi:MAG: hypothetical protein B7Y30_08735 [Campylobacterales bacterium 16-40-21]|nr:MAG: hypothetical protein B7Y30_08735 [Campylobacterales bacterium 16-40-21]